MSTNTATRTHTYSTADVVEDLDEYVARWQIVGLSIARYGRMLRLARILARRNGSTVEAVLDAAILRTSGMDA